MAKHNFVKGDCVRAKKWSGESFLGMYEHTYDDGSHCVVDPSTGKRFNVLKPQLKMATDEEAKEIKRLVKENNIEVRDKVFNTRVGHSKIEQDSELEAALAASE